MKLVQIRVINTITSSSASYFIIYVLLSLIYFSHGYSPSSLFMPSSDDLYREDQTAFLWFLNWWPFALIHNRESVYFPFCMATFGLQYVVGRIDPYASNCCLASYCCFRSACQFQLSLSCDPTAKRDFMLFSSQIPYS